MSGPPEELAPPVYTHENPFFKFTGKFRPLDLIKSGPAGFFMNEGETYVECAFQEGEIEGDGRG